MYTACMFCQKPLGSNEVIETFPVGRRLAFDAARGRLWVVCRKCERWNLTPLEERWEAVEDCERLYRGTRIRASTENIGLARHPEGLELVRIGKPPRGEFAAWRYGDQFGRRMRRHVMMLAGSVAWGFGVAEIPLLVALGSPSLAIPLVAWLYLRTVAKARVGPGEADPGGDETGLGARRKGDEVVRFRRRDMRSLRVLSPDREPGFAVQVRIGLRRRLFVGEDARRVAVALLPMLNYAGGSRGDVKDAVGVIESRGDPNRFLAQIANKRNYQPSWRRESGYVTDMFKPTRLALEMALHEEQERRALAGELWLLERAWREAEEIAAISDKLLLPESVRRFMEEERRTADEPDQG